MLSPLRYPELSELENDLLRFTISLEALASLLSLTLSDYHCDHISLRTNHEVTAQRWRQAFTLHHELISDKIINGRPILIFRLNTPLQIAGLVIPCVELPFPSKKQYPHEGWEHVELVVSAQEGRDYATQIAQMLPQGLHTQRQLKIKVSEPKGVGERLPNPTYAVSNGDVTIKFHPHSIEAVIMSELD